MEECRCLIQRAALGVWPVDSPPINRSYLDEFVGCYKPGRPRGGRAESERFNRTLLDEWAYTRLWTSDTARARTLDAWLHRYNHHRHHTVIGGPPSSRVNNLAVYNTKRSQAVHNIEVMTTPVEQITVECSDCGPRYEDFHRRSMNLALGDFDDDYLEQMSTTTYQECGVKRSISSLVVREVDNPWVFEV